MKNELKFYYNLDVLTITRKENIYYFEVGNFKYMFTNTERSIPEITEIYDLTEILIKNGIICHKIIKNVMDNVVTNINDKNYVLMQYKSNLDDQISFKDVIEFSIATKRYWNYNTIMRTNWPELWIEKIEKLIKIYHL